MTLDLLDDDVTVGARPSQPTRILLTLFGDYWWRRSEQLPSASLVALLAEFGVSDVAARAALSRLVRHGLLLTSKHGRRTFYGLSERAIRVLDDGVWRIFSFGQSKPPWDGLWSLVAFSIPEEKRHLRYVLRDRLHWLGFAPFYDGLWVSPHDRLSDVASELAELSITSVTMFRASIKEGTPETGAPQRAWDLDVLHTCYQRFIADVQALRSSMESGELSQEEALKARTYIMDSWRGFPALDPDLPDEMLPSDWPRARARQLFIEMYDQLGSLAQRRVQQIIARYSPELAVYARYHRAEERLHVFNK